MKTFMINFLNFIAVILVLGATVVLGEMKRAGDDDIIAQALDDLKAHIGVLKDRHTNLEARGMQYYHRYQFSGATDQEIFDAQQNMMVIIQGCEAVEREFYDIVGGYEVQFLIDNGIPGAMSSSGCSRATMARQMKLFEYGDAEVEETAETIVKTDKLKQWAQLHYDLADDSSNYMRAYQRYFLTAENNEDRMKWIAHHAAEAAICTIAVHDYNRKISAYTLTDLERRGIRLALNPGWCDTPTWLTIE